MRTIATLLALSATLFGLAAHAANSRTIDLSVTIRPAMQVTLQSGSALGVLIRLAPNSQANIWRDESCIAPTPGAYQITQSGAYTVPLTALEGQGSKVCIASTDGALSRMLNLPVLP